MPEDAGKKKNIQNFLMSISSGEGFIEDIWIERNIRSPKSLGEGSTAISLSGRKINNITELLEDDLKHSFHGGFFTFRIITAMKGSGKTSLLVYLDELIKANSNYQNKFIISRFPITDILNLGGDFPFNIKFYCYILADIFWNLLHTTEYLVQERAKNILGGYLNPDDVNRLVSANKLQFLRSNFIKLFSSTPINLLEFLFDTFDGIWRVAPHHVFVCLIDELDGLENQSKERQQTLVVIRSLLKGVRARFKSEIRLFVYLVGTNENVKDLFRDDPVIESLVSQNVVNLNTGYQSEFEMIKSKINNRIKGAFKGYKDFNVAWLEIEQISLKSDLTLRGFCQEYSRAILEIYEKYFKEAPEQNFEGKARDLVAAQSRQHWKNFLTQKSYTLSEVSTTTILEKHAFDCYVELLHNGVAVGRCFGEAKNYELLSSHLDTFSQWLQDVGFRGSASDSYDLAFMIAPSCPTLLQRKLELQNIHFIQSDKVVIIQSDKVVTGTQIVKKSIDLNSSQKQEIKIALKGTWMKDKAIDTLIEKRPFKDLEDLSKIIKISPTIKDKINTKISSGEVCIEPNTVINITSQITLKI